MGLHGAQLRDALLDRSIVSSSSVSRAAMVGSPPRANVA